MKIYTKTGDEGTTGLFGGERLSKASEVVDGYGELDELNSALGIARSATDDEDVARRLHAIQSDLFTIGSEVACAPERRDRLGIDLVTEEAVGVLEQTIDTLERDLPPLKTFILPGGSREASFLHWARTVTRRAERKIVSLAEARELRPEILRYLNRLSDLLFVMARHANHRAEVDDVPWP